MSTALTLFLGVCLGGVAAIAFIILKYLRQVKGKRRFELSIVAYWFILFLSGVAFLQGFRLAFLTVAHLCAELKQGPPASPVYPLIAEEPLGVLFGGLALMWTAAYSAYHVFQPASD